MLTILYPPTLPWGPLPGEGDPAHQGLTSMFQRPQQLMRALARCGVRTIFLDTAPPSETGVLTWEIEPNCFVCKEGAPWQTLVQGTLVVLSSHARQHHTVLQYGGQLIVWDCLDAAKEEFACWAPYVPKMRAQADLILCTAQALYDEHAPHRPGRVVLVPNGADYLHFSRDATVPADWPNTRGKVLGYIGAIAPWIDWSLINQLPDALGPDWDLVFIGQDFGSHVPRHPRLHALGYRPYATLPDYLAGMDVAMIPFRQSEMIAAVNPIKLYEYLASGTPVVATPMPELLPFSPPVRLAAGVDAFAAAVHAAGEEGTPGPYQRLASRHAWEARARQIIAAIEEHVSCATI